MLVKIIYFLSGLWLLGCSHTTQQCSVVEDSIYFPSEFNYHNIARLRDVPFLLSRATNTASLIKSTPEEDKQFYGSQSLIYSDNLLYEGVLACDKKKYDTFYQYSKKAYNIYDENKKHYLYYFSGASQKRYIEENSRYLQALFASTLFIEDTAKRKKTFNSWLNHKRTLFQIENSITLLANHKNFKEDVRWYFAYQKELANLYQNKMNSTKVKYINNKIIYYYKRIINKSSKIKEMLRDISTQRLSKLLKPRQVYIDFAKIGDIYYYFTLKRSGKITFGSLGKANSKQIDKTINKIQNHSEQIIKGSTFPNIELAKAMYASLYKNLFSKIDTQQVNALLISPDGMLNLLPFEALYDENSNKYMLEKYTISYIPSGKEFVGIHKKSHRNIANITVFANPDFQSKSFSNGKFRGDIFNNLKPNFKPLKGTLLEANSIKELFGSRVNLLLDVKANEQNLLNLKSPSMLHLATHGFFLDNSSIDNPFLKSGIVLSGANISIKKKTGMGIITGLELSGLNLRNTSLVTLSACQTGTGIIEDGEGVSGINQAFMKAGASNIVMSLWSVDDLTTSKLMQNFYANIHKGYSYSKALREAKLQMIKEGIVHPFYWAGFIINGRD